MANPSDYHNTAGRLLQMVTQAKAQPPNHKAIQAWASVFGLAADDYSGVLQRLALMLVAMQEVEREVRDTQKFPDLLLRDFPTLRQAVIPANLDGPWNHYVSHLTPPVLLSLEAIADALSKEQEIQPDEVGQVYQAVQDIFETVNSGNIKNPLRNAILELLASIKRLIDEYRIRGPKAFKEALTVMAGEIVLHPQAYRTMKEEAPSLFEKLGELAAKLSDLAARAEKLQPLLEYAGPVTEFVGKLLTGP